MPPPTCHFFTCVWVSTTTGQRLQKSESPRTPPLPHPCPTNVLTVVGSLGAPPPAPLSHLYFGLLVIQNSIQQCSLLRQQLQVILPKLTCSKLLGLHTQGSYPSPLSGTPLQHWSRLLSAPSCQAVVLLRTQQQILLDLAPMRPPLATFELLVLQTLAHFSSL